MRAMELAEDEADESSSSASADDARELLQGERTWRGS
jgi:hypothetical protein